MFFMMVFVHFCAGFAHHDPSTLFRKEGNSNPQAIVGGTTLSDYQNYRRSILEMASACRRSEGGGSDRALGVCRHEPLFVGGAKRGREEAGLRQLIDRG
jgi:hypothetical protein